MTQAKMPRPVGHVTRDACAQAVRREALQDAEPRPDPARKTIDDLLAIIPASDMLQVRTSRIAIVEYFKRLIDRQQRGEPEAEVLAWRERFPSYEYRPQDECVALKLKAPQPAEPVDAEGGGSSGQAEAASDEQLALDLLAQLFSAYENGTPCYTSPREGAGFVGNAFRLDGETFKVCSELLNRRRPAAMGSGG